MENKSRIWIVILALLVVAAIVGMVVLNNRLTDSKATINELTEQLNEALATPEPTEVPTEAPTAEPVIIYVTPEPTEVPAEAPTAEPIETPAEETTAADLEEAQAKVTDLEAQVEENNSTIDSLQTEIDTLKAQGDTDSDTISALESDLAEATEKGEDLQQQLDAATAEYNAYRIDHDPADGEANSSMSFETEIDIAADGVTADCTIANHAVSGNATEIALRVGEDEVYRSEMLAPGESLDAFTLSTPLAAGTYEGQFITYSYDADGNVIGSTFIPVTVNVAAQ